MKTRWYRALLMELLMELRKRLPRATRRKSSTGGTVSQGRAAGSADVEGDVWPPAVPSWAQEEDAVERAGSAAAAPRTRRRETLERL